MTCFHHAFTTMLNKSVKQFRQEQLDIYTIIENFYDITFTASKDTSGTNIIITTMVRSELEDENDEGYHIHVYINIQTCLYQ